jgi:integrase
MKVQQPTTTLQEALNQFQSDKNCTSNPRLISNLRTILKLYVLPHLPSHKFTKQELAKNLNGCLEQVSVVTFQESEPVTILDRYLKIALALGEIKPGTIRNYRSALERFTAWLQQETWVTVDPFSPQDDLFSLQEMGSPPIESRTPHVPTGRNLDTARRGQRCTSANPYALKPEHYTSKLKRQIEASLYELSEKDFSSATLKQLRRKPAGPPPNMGFHYFCTAPAVANRKDNRLREVTFEQTLKHINGFLGWYANIRHDIKQQELSLELLTDEMLLEEFITWGIAEKGNGNGWAHQVACSSLRVLKWLHHRRSKQSAYKDIEVIQTRRAYIDDRHGKYKSEGYRYNSEKNLEEKLLTFKECEELVQKLRCYCGDRRECDRTIRPESAVMRSWQRYLIIAILTYCPIRQFEIRHLQFNVNLFREPDGYWITWTAEQHKVGSKTGKGRTFPLLLPPEITADLDTWITRWQPRAKEVSCDVDEWLKFWKKANAAPKVIERWKEIFEHVEIEKDLVFFSLGSNPHRESFGTMWTSPHFYSLVAKAVYRFTGQRTSPHTFRNIGITHQRQEGDPDQRIALAEVMGHDPITADRIYDLTNSRDRSKKAKYWWKPRQINDR